MPEIPEPTCSPLFLLNAAYLTASQDWRTPEGHANSPYEVSTYIREAQKAERAGFDAFFQADFSGVQRNSIRSGPPVNAFEPFQLAGLVASATDSIAVMPTASTLHTHPFTLARNLASLDRISRGRAWVNIVSSFRSGTGIGVTRRDAKNDRHLQTEEFVAVARKLWKSWPPEALVQDSVSGEYIAAELISDINHHGEFYEHQGPIDMAPYSNDFPFVLQATSSTIGLELAARTADGVFAGTPSQGAAHHLRAILHKKTKEATRQPGAVKLLPGAFIHVLDPSEAQEISQIRASANNKLRTSLQAVAHLHQRFPKLNLKDLSPSQTAPSSLLPATAEQTLEEYGSAYLPLWDEIYNDEAAVTVGELAARATAWGEHAQFWGTPDQISEEITSWIRNGAVDGFQFILGNHFDLVCDEILPAVRGAQSAHAHVLGGGDHER